MTDLTRVLADYIELLRTTELPGQVIDQTRLYMTDCFAAAMAGYKINRDFNRAVEKIYFNMGGREDSAVLFTRKRLPAMNAAFINAVYVHGADMDDGNKKAMGHVSAPVIPAVLALAETLDVTEAEVMTAINAGYEVYCRVGAAVQPGLVHRGFHSTGTAGVIAAAAACASLMNLDTDGIYNAMSLATTQASGLIIVAESGQSAKPINPARAASCGILSAQLAAQGIIAFRNPLQSPKGWMHAMSNEIDENMITDGLGENYSIMECYLKPYPSCRHTHCGLQAAASLYPEIDAPVESVKLYIYPNAISIAGQIIHPLSAEDSKFSIHYSLACMLVNGCFGLADLDASAAGKAVEEMTNRIELIADEAMENRDDGIRGARLELTLSNGKKLSETVTVPKGDAANPFTRHDMTDKLTACAEGVVDADTLERLLHRLDNFGGERKFKPILLD